MQCSWLQAWAAGVWAPWGIPWDVSEAEFTRKFRQQGGLPATPELAARMSNPEVSSCMSSCLGYISKHVVPCNSILSVELYQLAAQEAARLRNTHTAPR